MNGRGCVPLNLCLQKQVVGQIWTMGPTPALELDKSWFSNSALLCASNGILAGHLIYLCIGFLIRS